MSYFFHTLQSGLRLYFKSTFYLSALAFIFIAPASYIFFELGLAELLLKACMGLSSNVLGLDSALATQVTSYCFLVSALYLPASFWIATSISVCLAVSTGHYPSFGAIFRTSISQFGSIFIARLLAQIVMLVPFIIISIFCAKAPHIIPMYGAVIIPAIAYFTLYISLRYVFVEVIIICERVGPFKALSLCSQITDGQTLRIFLLQQTYLALFILINWLIYSLLHSVIQLSDGLTNWIITIVLGNVNSFLIVTTYYIYVSFAIDEDYSELENTSDQLFGRNNVSLERSD